MKLQRNITYGSILPIVVFIAGLLVIYFFSSQLFGEGMITMLFSSFFYIIMILIRSSDVNPPTQFNLILENLSSFMTFGISSILFGVMFYSPNVELLFILFIYFFAIACILSIARNWEYDVRDALGFPIAFNGIFFPLFYYMYKFYFHQLGDSIFILYYLIAGVLIVSNYKFLWFDEKYIKHKAKYESIYKRDLLKSEIEDKIVQDRLKQRENKEFDKEKDKKSQKEFEKKVEEKYGEKIQKKYEYKPELLEDSILEKIQKKIKNTINKTDSFNKIPNMPTIKELDETLPHTNTSNNNSNDDNKDNINLNNKKYKTVNKAFNIKPKPKRKKKLFQKIIGYLYSKFGNTEVHWSDISGMPKEKELKETLTSTQNLTENPKQTTNTPQKNQSKQTQNTKPQQTHDLVSGDNSIKVSEKEVREVFSNQKTTDSDNDEDYDFNQEIEIPQTNKPQPTQQIEDNEEFDLGEYENDYK